MEAHSKLSCMCLHVALLATAALPHFSQAADANALTVQSVMPVVINSDNPQQSVHKTTLRLRQVGTHTPVALEVIEARLPGRPANFLNAFKFGKLESSAAGILVPVEVELRRATFAGTYSAKARPVFAEADKVASPGELTLEFVRQPAQLIGIAELYIERDAATESISPAQIHLTEKAKLAFAEFSFPIIVRDIRGPLGQSLPAELQLQGQGVLPAGGSLQVKPVLSGSLPLGTSSGTVRLDAPQLANPVDVKFRLLNRVSSSWLPIAIIIFIGFGLLFRKLMADRQVLDQGLLEAQRAYARLKALQDAQGEANLRDAIGGRPGIGSTAHKREVRSFGYRHVRQYSF